MKSAIITLLVMASTVATVAVAQDGTGHGPPRVPKILVPQTPIPRMPSPTGSVQKYFQPKSGFASN
jgi:hypothetical protein